MTIWNLGSINIDRVYRVPHLPQPGETLASTELVEGLGGKGANMSVAAARAGAQVKHIGAIGPDGKWTADRLYEYGVDTRFVATLDMVTGHAIIAVDAAGENAIILAPSANRAIGMDLVDGALSEASVGDWFVTQNETSSQAEAVARARAMGLKVAYAAAPFEVGAVQAVLGSIDLLILNEIEAEQLRDALGKDVAELGVADVIVTRGGDGADWIGPSGRVHLPAVPATPVDTTGAGDTFTGYVLAGLDYGMPMEQAMRRAAVAGALMVERVGTADVIPDLAEVQARQGAA